MFFERGVSKRKNKTRSKNNNCNCNCNRNNLRTTKAPAKNVRRETPPPSQ
jgi:hypothetical protein